jgi:hypothetical protein
MRMPLIRLLEASNLAICASSLHVASPENITSGKYFTNIIT